MKKLLTLHLMKVFTSLCLIGILSFGATAQEFKASLKAGEKLKLESIPGSIYVEEYAGSEVIVQVPGYKLPEKAKGMTLITGGNDNTGIGLNQRKEGKMLILTGIRKKEVRYNIKVPKGAAFGAKLKSVHSNRLEINNFTGELEIDVRHTKVVLNNISGPILLNATHEGPKIVFSKLNQNKPSSIVCPHGDIDLTLPANTKANITASSSYGDIFTNMDIKLDKESSNGLTKKSKIKGKLNGGGVEIEIRSPFQNIYIRKK